MLTGYQFRVKLEQSLSSQFHNKFIRLKTYKDTFESESKMKKLFLQWEEQEKLLKHRLLELNIQR